MTSHKFGEIRSVIRQGSADILVVVGFYTRLPTWRIPLAQRETDFARVQWAAPIAGALIGLILGLFNAALDGLDIPDVPRGIMVVAAGLLLTGALHEDGLADIADGFGGGADKERKLAIMKDSRLGTYGTLALIASFGLRASLVAALTSPTLALTALVSAHASARAMMPLMLAHLPNARGTGVAFRIGTPSPGDIGLALFLAVLALLLMGPLATIAGITILAAAYLAIWSLAINQIGGQTGDVCGALEQTGEIAVLTVCVTLLI
ncbi:adenosylcobinamide-GDP ribazoletransferase [Notoacmeibacter ruber]|uniref:Adenosylcobinamide-GDP ribazoletransferase n=1 Tax=Notoacmeibacter ruber TaxID=2670375 RepID=A0A3L7JCR7_9HYPH|nr:adenosylcobinamide-GDP ribazoletransferase [Notoacmeibacter ruber]RLQ88270.1 adenosylcobinamide-GDP ribazoletransferase [Notoacmeibacter ruber]